MDTATVNVVPFLSSAQLADQLGRAGSPLTLDVHKAPAFDAASRIIPGALRLCADEAYATVSRLARERGVVVYCVHGQVRARRHS